MSRESRYPVKINGEILRAIFTKPAAPHDTRPYLTRLVSSLKLVVRGSLQKGIHFIGIRGGADF